MSGQRDGVRGIAPVSLLEPGIPVADADSAGLDTRDGTSSTILVHVGGTVDAGATFILEESSDDGVGDAYAAVDVALDQIGDVIPTPLLPDTVYRAGYVGNKRFVRAALTIPGATDIAVVGVVGHLDRTPQDDL